VQDGGNGRFVALLGGGGGFEVHTGASLASWGMGCVLYVPRAVVASRFVGRQQEALRCTPGLH
jgi:hypothetical protein